MLMSWRHNIWPEMSFLYYGEVLWFVYFKTFWLNYKLDLRSYGQLLSLFFVDEDEERRVQMEIEKKKKLALKPVVPTRKEIEDIAR